MKFLKIKLLELIYTQLYYCVYFEYYQLYNFPEPNEYDEQYAEWYLNEYRDFNSEIKNNQCYLPY